MEKKCVMCDKLWGVFGLLISVAFIYISIDVLTDGAITRVISGSGREAEEVEDVQ